MRNQLFNKKIPTIFGIGLVVLSLILTNIVVKSQTSLKSRASDSQKPLDLKVTNITDASFTITYQTELPSTGSISYGSDKKLGESELEDVDKEKGSFSPKKIHSISVRKLLPATKYYLTIISGTSTYLNNRALFEAATGDNISSASAKSDLASAKQRTIKGKIVLPDGSAPLEALVYLNAENSQLLSSTVSKDGKFSFPLKELRTDDLSSYFNVQDNTVFKIFATNGSLKSTALASLSQADSIPTITLSNDYNFTNDFAPSASKSAESKSVSFPVVTTKQVSLKPQILTPKKDQSFTNQKPQFSGTSLPNEKVEIIINSTDEITTQVTADSNGNWIYRPSVNLSPGVHTITIKTRDSEGILTTIMQSFTVFAAETQTSGTATPSATPIPTLTPTPTIAILIPTPTSTPTPFPTLAPIESKGGLPPTGSSSVGLIIGGIISTLTGVALFLLTRAIL